MRPRYPAKTPTPPALPPEERTVGQLIAESIKLYGDRFFFVVTLGLAALPPDLVSAALDGGENELGVKTYLRVLAQAPFFSAAYVGACVLVTGVSPGARRLAGAYCLAVVLYLPVVLLVSAFVLPALAWLAFVGLAVPAYLVEDVSIRGALRRGVALARADYLHAWGGICGLVLVFVVARGALAALLHGQGGNTVTGAAMLADVILFPVVFVGSALLYVDQSARLRVRAAPVPA